MARDEVARAASPGAISEARDRAEPCVRGWNGVVGPGYDACVAELTRDQAIAVLEQGNAMLGVLFARLSDASIERPRTIGGGDWSAKDLMGHVAFWEELAVDLLAAQRERRPPRVAAIVGPGGVDRANAEDQARSATMPLAEVRARAAAAHRALVDGIAALDDAAWQATPAHGADRGRSLGRMLGSITGAPDRPFGHAWAHLADLEAYVAAAADA
jgi:hypothetical protein